MSLEVDQQLFTQGLRLLHSSNKDSAEQLRSLLDEVIKQKHGPAKMLCNVLHKKYTMEEPVLSDHSSSGSGKKSRSSSSKHSSKSSKNSSPVNLPSRDTPPEVLQSDDTLALEILEDDLTCVICKGMDVGARNRLVECDECHSLYHQECHVPHIQESQIDVPRSVWYCSNCSKASTQVSKERSSPKTVIEAKPKESKKSSSTSSSKHTDKYKSSTTASQSQSINGNSSTSGSSSGPKATPNIHIISADRRLKDLMKKAKHEKRGTGNSGGTNSSSKHSLLSSSTSSKSSQDKSRINLV